LSIKDLLPKQIDSQPKFLLTHAASGSAVVANDTIVAQIRGLNDSIRAVDMESYGFYDACLKTFVAKPKFICLKAVSDFCNGEKGDDYHKYCSLLSAISTRRLLSEFIDFI
jgi:nucleoside phosphorylase